MTDLDDFKSYCDLADQLYEAMTPEQILDCLRILALHLVDYRSRFEVIPKQDLLDLAGATELTRRARPTAEGRHANTGGLPGVGAAWMGRRGCANPLMH